MTVFLVFIFPLRYMYCIIVIDLKRHKLFPHAVPSQKLPQRSHHKLETLPQKRQKEARQWRAHARQRNNM